jgi:hypothetical protein
MVSIGITTPNEPGGADLVIDPARTDCDHGEQS